MSDEPYVRRPKGATDGIIRRRRIQKDKEEMKLRHSAKSVFNPQGKIPELFVLSGILSNDANWQLESAKYIRELLKSEWSFSLNEIYPGILLFFVEFLNKDDFPQLQVEAAEVLTMVTAGSSEDTKLVIDHGVVPLFVKLFNSPNKDVCEKAVWLLGNIASDSPMSRDIVLNHGVLNHLLELMDKVSEIKILSKATWVLSALCQGTPKPPFEQVKPAYSLLQRLIYLDDEEVLRNAFLSLCYISDDGTIDKIQPLIEAEVFPRIVELLSYPSRAVVAPAVHVIRNLVAVDKRQAQCVIDHGGLLHLLQILSRDYIMKSIKKDACFIISNIAAGTHDQIQAVIDANLIGPLVYLLQAAEFDLKKEAASVIFHVITRGTPEHIRSVVLTGCILPMCDLLGSRDLDMVRMCLLSIDRIFRTGELEKKAMPGGRNIYAQLIFEAGGLEKIGNMEFNDNPEISEEAVKISDTYDHSDEEVD
ncbi:OLC1v1035440C1 [Oldenlandia corymbosa var. corymbosa]|nr:OLC1v1035440C1 [Oldenlandia corymbosa var. corymbosa]